MAMTALHRFTRRLLWRVAAVCAVLLFASWLFGAGSVWQIVEWVPMTIAVLLVAGHVTSVIRRQRN
jgi:membrane protease YdiL (CAAX protease family)